MPDRVKETLDQLQEIDRLRSTRALQPIDAVRSRLDGRTIRIFSSNDYLGLSAHPEVREAAIEVLCQRGMGSRSASLICGYSDLHEALEADIATLKGTEAALLFPTGYQANLGVLSVLGGPDAAIFSDELNHASIIDGCRLSRAAAVHIFRHRDMDHLSDLLAASTARRKVIVSDAVFSMDGDHAPLRELAWLKRRFGALLILDEAHTTLLYGPTGSGLAEAEGVTDDVDYLVLTLSKAIGAQGGAVACSSRRRELLLNRARSFVFTTALPAPVVAAASAAIRVASEDSSLRRRLFEHVEWMATTLDRPLSGPIVPIVYGSESATLTASAQLLAAGFHASAIRPPTVPEGTCRLRVTLSAAHSRRDLQQLVAALPTP